MVTGRSLGKLILEETKFGLGNRMRHAGKAGRRAGSRTDTDQSNTKLDLMGMLRTGGIWVMGEVVSTQRAEKLQKQVSGCPCLALVETPTTFPGQEGGEMSHLSLEGMKSHER